VDYDFTYDDYGKSIIQLEMGQEATAVWLNSDVIGDKTTLLAILELIDDLEKGVFKEKVIKSRNFEVRFTRDEVDIEILTNDELTEEHEEEGLSLYNCEHTSGCGLEDLKALLENWKDFKGF
jgi:uncharacterized protein YacL (UPF0231 family)|tara:strand:+ start:298 stop:663 length:366 start_codon:yes stop_codon:yes gene_type:complete